MSTPATRRSTRAACEGHPTDGPDQLVLATLATWRMMCRLAEESGSAVPLERATAPPRTKPVASEGDFELFPGGLC